MIPFANNSLRTNASGEQELIKGKNESTLLKTKRKQNLAFFVFAGASGHPSSDWKVRADLKKLAQSWSGTPTSTSRSPRHCHRRKTGRFDGQSDGPLQAASFALPFQVVSTRPVPATLRRR